MTHGPQREWQADGIVTRLSPWGLDATLNRLLTEVADRGLRLFALIDHDGAAEDAGLELAPRRVVVFGSPVAGTPLMAAHPLMALQLPLRVLVWEGADGRVRLSHLTPAELTRPAGVDPADAPFLGGAAALVAALLADGADPIESSD
jgi:uncharacterized protein (DUF302 family)